MGIDAHLAYGLILGEEYQFKSYFPDHTDDDLDTLLAAVNVPDTVEYTFAGSLQYGDADVLLIIPESQKSAYDLMPVNIELDTIHGVDWNADLLEAYQYLKAAATGDFPKLEPGWILYALHG